MSNDTIDLELSRRTLLIMGSAAAAGNVVCACAIIRGGASHESFSAHASAMKGNELRVPLQEISRLPKGDALLIRPPSPHPEMLVAARGEGGYYAVTAECTHKGCTVDWNASVNEWQCPCHDSRYDASGKVLEGPAKDPLREIETRSEDQELVLIMPA